MGLVSMELFGVEDAVVNDAAICRNMASASSSKSTDTIVRLGQEVVNSTVNIGYVRKFNMVVKRVFDIIASFVALLFISPFLLAISVLIKIESSGSPIFVQVRWGLDRRKITVYKFRTMFADECDPSGTIQTISDDKRVTRIGRILRKTNIDELPQLFNVLRGDMSLVGPRCHPVGMLAAGMLYEDFISSYHIRHSMRPGITGLAQVNGFRGPTTNRDLATARIKNDLEYIAEFSFISDLKIIFLTIVREIFSGRGS